MITSIQVHEDVKRELDSLKKSTKESYEDVIIKLIKASEKYKREQKKLLKEGYKEMAEESLKITKEFEAIEEVFDLKW